VSFLEWVAMPVISRLLGPWLRANENEGRGFSLVGLALILGAPGLDVVPVQPDYGLSRFQIRNPKRNIG
jgi:hypothetical protein